MTFQLLSWLKISPLKASPVPLDLVTLAEQTPSTAYVLFMPSAGFIVGLSRQPHHLPFLTKLLLQLDILNIVSFKRKAKVRPLEESARGFRLMAGL